MKVAKSPMSLAKIIAHNPAGSHGSDEARDTDGTAHRRIVRALKAIVFDGLHGLGEHLPEIPWEKNGEKNGGKTWKSCRKKILEGMKMTVQVCSSHLERIAACA